MSLDRQSIEAARTDVAVFAELLIGEPLWPHQLDLARSDARIRCVCSGRQAGKSRTLAVLSLHEAFARPGTRVLIISAGEEAAKDLLSEISALAKSPLLTGSVLDDERHQINLTNGSSIRSVPASEKQVRGKSVDLLVIDEAAFVSEEIWTAARYTAVGRQGSRIVMASTPWGPKDRFFALTYRAGVRHEAGYESIRWPSTASPMVDAELLEMWRATSPDREYRREVLAEWVDSDGSYFTDAELESAISDYSLTSPEDAQGRPVNGGVDWGFARDSSALVLVAAARPGELAGEWPDRTLCIPWIEDAVGVTYRTFVRRVLQVARGYQMGRLASETNGVGAMPTEELKELGRGRIGRLIPVATTAATKEEGFGRIKVLIEQGRLALPRHPALLSQLSALEYQERESGNVRIAVPERAGHDDLAMALCLAIGVSDVASKPRRGMRTYGEELRSTRASSLPWS
jgi:Terminase large subunit, T4likevirus-type, N-terminal/Terminase RNaseH-like domain